MIDWIASGTTVGIAGSVTAAIQLATKLAGRNSSETAMSASERADAAEKEQRILHLKLADREAKLSDRDRRIADLEHQTSLAPVLALVQQGFDGVRENLNAIRRELETTQKASASTAQVLLSLVEKLNGKDGK